MAPQIIIERIELFLCYRLHNPVSGDQSLGIFFKDAFLYVFVFCVLFVSQFFFIHTVHAATRFDICFPFTEVTSICPFYTMLPATRKKEALFLFFSNMVWKHFLYSIMKLCFMIYRSRVRLLNGHLWLCGFVLWPILFRK